MKIQTRMYLWKLPESIENAMSFDVIQVKNFKISMETLITRDPLLPKVAHFPKVRRFQRSKGRGLGKFSRGQYPGPQILLASLSLRCSPPNMNFVPTGLN